MRTTLVIALLLAFCVMGLWSQTPTPTCSYCTMSIRVRVTNKGAVPIAGAEILVLSSLKGTTDADGYLDIALSAPTGCGLAGDTYVYAQAPDYVRGSYFTPLNCSSTSMNFVLAIDPALHVLGDVNNDKGVTIVDALMIAQYTVGLANSTFFSGAANVNNDYAITIVDALIVAQYYVGLITTLPVGG